VLDALRSGWLTHGEHNRHFEDAFAAYVGAAHAVSLNAGTSALFLALKAANITGDVIVPSFTFADTVNAVVTAGATPVFADVDPDTGCLDPASVAHHISDKTEAVIAAHFAGHPAQIHKLQQMCDKHELLFVENASDAAGAEYRGYKVGSFGVGCFSFFPSKNMTTGEGGMVTTGDSALADAIRLLAAQGVDTSGTAPHPGYRTTTLPGYNYRMSNMLAALGAVQLRKLDRLNNRRRKLARLYREFLGRLPEIQVPIEKNGCKHVYQMYTIRVDPMIRNDLVRSLVDKGINASVHFHPPVHQQTYYRHTMPNISLPVTEQVSREIVSLPMYPDLHEQDVADVAMEVQRFFQRS